jgi:hypothetical protein
MKEVREGDLKKACNGEFVLALFTYTRLDCCHFHFIFAVILDLKGCQYRGRIFPGPTAMILTAVQKRGVVGQQLKMDGVTDEFCRLTKTGDSMAKLTGVVQGDMKDYDYRAHDVDVNRNVPASAPSSSANTKIEAKSEETKSKDKGIKSASASGKGTANPRKRGGTTTSSTTAPKKRKSVKSSKK